MCTALGLINSPYSFGWGHVQHYQKCCGGGVGLFISLFLSFPSSVASITMLSFCVVVLAVERGGRVTKVTSRWDS